MSGSPCTDDATCLASSKKQPSCKYVARTITTNLETLCWCLQWTNFESLCTVKMIDDEVADARIKNECSDSDCFEQKSVIETKFTKSTKSTKSSAPLRMGFARINAVNAIIAVISVVLSLVFI